MSRRAAAPHVMPGVRFLQVDVTETRDKGTTVGPYSLVRDGVLRFDEAGDRLCCLAFNNKVYTPYATLPLPKSFFLSIIHHECTSPSIGLRFLLSSEQYDPTGQYQMRAALGIKDKTPIVDVILPDWSGPAVFAFLQSLATKWPDVRIFSCSCCAAPPIPTCDRPEDSSIDRVIWPCARFTLVEWNPQSNVGIHGVLTEIVVMKNVIVFHLDPPHINLALNKSDILFKPPPIIYPFVGVKLHLASSQYAHAIIEIADKDDLPAFMNALLFHWCEQTMSDNAPPDFDISHLSLKESMHGNAEDPAEEDGYIIAKRFPALRMVERPPVLLQNSFMMLDRWGAGFSAINQVEKFTLTNLSATRVIIVVRFAPGEQNRGHHYFNVIRGFVKPGASLEITLRQKVLPVAPVLYLIRFARVAAHVTDAEKAYKHTIPCGYLAMPCRAE